MCARGDAGDGARAKVSVVLGGRAERVRVMHMVQADVCACVCVYHVRDFETALSAEFRSAGMTLAAVKP